MTPESLIPTEMSPDLRGCAGQGIRFGRPAQPALFRRATMYPASERVAGLARTELSAPNDVLDRD
jgi:hypothetical protein